MATKLHHPTLIHRPHISLGPVPSAESKSVPARRLLACAFVLIALGVAWRVIHYFLRFPIWGDEAFVCLNMTNQTFAGLTGQLRHAQVAPLLFLWGELSAFRLLGGSELTMRLLPLLAGLSSLALFWRLARLTLSPLAFALAVGAFAAAHSPVAMSALVKPYAFDLLMSLALLVAATEYLRQPERVRWLGILALIVPVALLSSYSAVFIAGAVSLALLPAVWRQRRWKILGVYAAYNILMFGGFVLSSVIIGGAQLDRTSGLVKTYLQEYWAFSFPPAHPLALMRWLAWIHTGRMMAYPIGEANGASSLTFLVFLMGIWQLWSTRRRALLILCLAPFVLGLTAAALHRYPYGGCWRLSQHLAPIICLVFGVGAAGLVERCRTAAAQQRCTLAVFSLFALVPLVGIVIDVVKPYRSQGDLWTRRVAAETLSHVRPEDQVVIINTRAEMKPLFQWFLERNGKPVFWNGEVDNTKLAAGTGRIWCVYYNPPIWRYTAASSERIAEMAADVEKTRTRDFDAFKDRLAKGNPAWTVAAHVPFTLVPTDGDGPIERCDLYEWTCKNPVTPDPISCWP